QRLKLASYIVPVRSQYAVVLAYCGDIIQAEAEMARLASYEASLSTQGQTELRDQQRLIAQIKQDGPPPQLEMPENLPRSMDEIRRNMFVKKVGRNERCPCG